MNVIQDLLFERVIEYLEEDVQVLRLLNIRTILNVAHVVDNLVHHGLIELHAPHCCVYQVQLLVEHRILLVHRGHERSHVTKNEGSDDCACNDD